MNTLTLNGRGALSGASSSNITIGSSASTWTIGDGTTSTVNLNANFGPGGGAANIYYNVAANLVLNQATTLFTGNGSAGIFTNAFDGFVFSGNISQASSGYGITKDGTSVLTLSGTNNTFTGNININSTGTLRIGGAGVLGAGNYAGDITFGAAGRFTYSSSAAQTLSGAITGATGILTKDTGAGKLTLQGTTSNTYGGLTTVSAGTLELNKTTNATRAIAGNITVTASTLQYAATAGDDQIADAAAVTLANGAGVATLNLNGISDTIGSLTIGGASGTGTSQGIVTTGAGTLTLGGNVQYTSTGATSMTHSISGNLNLGATTRTFSIQNNGAAIDFDVSAAITGSGVGLIKTSGGALQLSGTNTYTGVTTVSAGTLQINKKVSLYNNTPASWTAANINVASGATLALNVDGSNGFDSTSLNTLLTNISVANTSAQGLQGGANLVFDTTNAGGSFTHSGAITNSTGGYGGVISLTKIGTGALVLDNTNTYTGTTTITTGTLQLGSGSGTGSLNTQSQISVGAGTTFAVNQSDTVTQGTDFSNVAITGAGNFLQSGAGTTVLNLANTYTGTTTVSAGALELTNALALQNSALVTTGAGNVTLTGVTTPTFGGLSGASGDLATVISSGYAGITNLTLNPSVTQTYGGVIANNAANLSLTKTGAGTQILQGANTYSGATNINAGTLELSGAAGALASTAINLNGGNLTLINVAGQSAVNRVSDSATITANGGTITWTNPSADNTANWAENIGTLSLSTGQANIVSTNAVNAARSQILTLGAGSLTHPAANTSAITFSGASLGTTADDNNILITSQTDTTANKIIGSWATYGTSAAAQTDYAAYNITGGVGNTRGIQGAAIAASDQTTWGIPENAYTVNAGAAGTGSAGLTATRAITALRSISGANAMTVDNVGNTFALTSNTFANGDAFILGGTAPTGLTTGTTYYVVGKSGSTFQVAATSGGGAIDFSTNGTSVTATGAITLSTGNNLETYGLLNGVATTTFVVANGTGALSTPTGGGNLFLNAGSGAITINAPITDHSGGGVTTLVKSGNGTLVLNNTIANTYTGNTILNAGTLTGATSSNSLTPPNPFGTSALQLNGGTLSLAAIGILDSGFQDVTFGNNTTVGGNVTVSVDRFSGAGSNKTLLLGTLSIGANTLTATTTLGTFNSAANAGYILGFGATTASGAATFTNTVMNTGGLRLASLTLANSVTTGTTTTITFDGLTGTTNTITGVVSNNSVDATKVLSLTKTGAGTLSLTGANTFTGGIFLNSGTLNTNSAALNNNLITVNGTASLILPALASTNSGITLNPGSALSLLVPNSSFTVNGAVTGAGNLVVREGSSGNHTYSLNSTSNTFTGGVDYSVSSNGNGRLNVNSFADSATPGAGNIRFGIVAGTSGQDHTFALGSGAIVPLTINNRQFDIAGTTNANVPTINNDSTQAFTINSNLIATGTGTRTLALGGIGAGLSTFTGIIGNGNLTTLGLTKAGAGGTWVLSGSNTYTGKTTISAGTLSINSIQNASSTTGNPLGTPGVGANSIIDIATTGTLRYTGTGHSSDRVINLTTLTGGTFTLNASGASGTFALTGGVTSAATSSTSTLALTGTGLGSQSGVIANSATAIATAITKSGTGTWTLTGPNTNTGTTTISGGTLQVGDGTTGKLNNTTGTALTFTNSGTINFNEAASSTQGMGLLTLTAGEATIQSTFVGTSATLTFTNVTARSAGASVNFVQSGGSNGSTNSIILTQYNGANTVAGAFIDKGVFFNGSAYAVANGISGFLRPINYDGSNSTSNPNTIAGSTHVQLNTTPLALQPAITLLSLNLSAGGVNWTNSNASTAQTLTVPGILKSGGGTVSTISGGGGVTTASNAELVIRTDLSTDLLNISTPISGFNGGLTKSGAGTLTLSAVNTYTGATNVNGGTLSLTGSLTTNGAININGTAIFTQSTGYSGIIGGNTNSTFVHNSTGTSILSLPNTFTGATTVNAGTLSLTNAFALQNSALTSVAGGGLVTLDPSITTPTFGGVAGPVNLATFISTNYGGITNLILNPASGVTAAYSGNIVNGASGMSLTKNGAGTQTLSGNLSYTGATILNAGVLNLAGTATLANSSGLTFNAGGGLTLTNTTAAEAALNRVSDSAGIISNGGNITVTNTASATQVYAETMGALDLRSGQLNITSTTANTADVATQTLTFGSNSLANVNGAARTSATTSAITFSGATLGLNVRNAVIIPGQGNSGVGEIIAPWATFGTTAALQTDYATYNRTAGGTLNAFGVQNAAIAATTNDSTWSTATAATSNYNFANGTTGLTISGGTKNINTLRHTGGVETLTVASSNNLGTLGILNGVSSLFTIAATGTGVVTLPTTTSDNLHVNTGSGAITISAPIADNGAGLLTLVKNGSAGTLTLSGANTFTGGIVINAGTVALSNATDVNNGTGTVTVNTGGTLLVNVGATLSRSLTLNGGTLQTSGSGTNIAISSPITLAANTISTFTSGTNNTEVLNISGPIDGSGGLIRTNASSVIRLNGTNTYTGTTRVSSGLLIVKSSLYGNDTSKWTSANITVASGATLQMNVGGVGEFTMAQVNTMFTSLSTSVNNNGLLGGATFGVDTTNATAGSTLTYSGVVADSTGAGGGALNFKVSSNANKTTELTGNNTYTGITILDGVGPLRVSSLNSVSTNAALGTTRSASSSLGAPTTVANGTIYLGQNGSPSTYGNGSPGGTLVYTGSGETTDRVINLAGNAGATYTLDQSGTGLLKFTSPFTTSATGSVFLQGSTAGSGEIAGALPLSASLNYTKNGTGTWTFSGANLYSGTTTVNLGTLAGTQNSGTPFGTNALTIGAGIVSLAPSGSGSAVSLTGGTLASGTLFTYNADATLSLARGSQTSLTYTFGGTLATTARGTNGTLILSTSDIANFGTLGSKTERFIMNGTAPTTVSNLVSGVVIQDRNTANSPGDFAAYNVTDGFTKASYTLTNTFAASTNASVVNITANNPTGGAALAYALRVDNATLTNTSTLTLGPAAAGVAQIILNNGTISGGTSLTTTGSQAIELTIYTSGTSVISTPVLTATSQAGISVFGPGTLALSSASANTFTGGLRVNNSTVIATNDNQLGGATSQINLIGGTLQTSGTFALGGAGQRAIVLAAGQDQLGGTFNVTGTTTFQNATSGSKILSGTGSLTKTGAGTLELTGNTGNTYTGATFVNNGTLDVGKGGVAAHINSTSGINVAAGAKLLINSSTALTVGPVLAGNTIANRAVLGGTGTINAAVTLNDVGDVLSPGNSPGIQNYTPAQSWSSFSYDWEINNFTGTTAGTSFDQIALGSTLNLSGGSGSYILNVLGLTSGDLTGLVPNFSEIDRSWTVLTSVGTLTGFDVAKWTINTTGFTDPDAGSWSLSQSGNNLVLNYMAVPEPSTALLTALGVLVLLRRRR